jgi:RNA polymerase sigma-70 factor (ECF subfamily)
LGANDPQEKEQDAELASRVLEGDEAAFCALVERLGPGMLRVATSLLGDRGAAEEVVQETWEAALAGLARFEERSSLKTWLFRILVNRARTRRTRDARAVPFSSMEDATQEDSPAVDPSRFLRNGHWGNDTPRAWESDTPERLILLRESRKAIEAALAGLPPAQRAVVTMRDVEGFSSEEVCEALQISEANQRVLLHRGRSKLRAALESLVKAS